MMMMTMLLLRLLLLLMMMKHLHSLHLTGAAPPLTSVATPAAAIAASAASVSPAAPASFTAPTKVAATAPTTHGRSVTCSAVGGKCSTHVNSTLTHAMYAR
jgi:hypothetical protein